MKPREPRREVLIQARMRTDRGRFDVCIRNISSRGLLLQAVAPPARGSYIEIFCGPNTIVGRIVWSKHRRFGVQTQHRLNVDAVIGQSARLPSARELAAARMSESRSPAPHKLTAAEVAQRLERSRRVSATFEFGCIAACSAAVAALTVSVVWETLARPLQSVSRGLQAAE